MSTKNSIDTIGNRNHDLKVCNAAPPRVNIEIPVNYTCKFQEILKLLFIVPKTYTVKPV